MAISRTLIPVVVIAVVLFVLPSRAVAGAECEYSEEDILRALTKLVERNTMEQSGAGPIGCELWRGLRHGTGWYLGSKFVGGRTPTDPKIAAAQSKRREKLTKVCEPAMQDGPDEAKTVCFALLMRTHSLQMGTHSALESLESFDCGLPLGRLIGFKSSSPLARHVESQWNQEGTAWCGPQGCHCEKFPRALPKNKKRTRRRERLIRNQRLRVLSAISWVGDASSLTWIKDVALRSHDQAIRERADVVLKNLRTQHVSD